MGAHPPSSPVDVIIPVFNGARYLELCVRSVVAQTLPPARIFIADDGSEDETPQIAQRLQAEIPSVRYLRLPHGGVSAARNAGIRASTAPFVAFLDADDVWHPLKLEEQMAVFRDASAEVGFVHCSYYYIDEDGNDLDSITVFPPSKKGRIFSEILFDDYVVSGSASGVIARREVLDQAGYFDERLFHGEDLDVWLRLAAVSSVDYSPKPLVGIRVNTASAQRLGGSDRTLEFFLQRMLVFGKWPEQISARPDFVQELRRQASFILLPHISRPLRVDKFYRSLTSRENNLGRSLFRGRVDLWTVLAARLAQYAYWRLRKLSGLEKRELSEAAG